MARRDHAGAVLDPLAAARENCKAECALRLRVIAVALQLNPHFFRFVGAGTHERRDEEYILKLDRTLLRTVHKGAGNHLHVTGAGNERHAVFEFVLG